LPEGLQAKVEVRNQARVHLWFGSRFGRDYPPLASAEDALNRALATVHAVSVRLDAQDELIITAPLHPSKLACSVLDEDCHALVLSINVAARTRQHRR